MKDERKVPSIRFKGFSDDWEQRKLGEIGDVITGTTPDTNNSEYYSDDGIPWVTPTDIISDVTFSSAKKLSELGREVARVVPKNSILVTCIASIGKNTILGTEGSFNQQINCIIPREKEFDPYFLYSESEIWANEMSGWASSGTMQIVNKSEFSALVTCVPNYQEQGIIGQFFYKIDTLITLHQRKLDKLKNVKKALLEKMFPAGESSVPKLRFKGFTDDWEQRKLKDIAAMHARIGWQNLRTSEFLDQGDYYLITGTDFDNGEIDFAHCHYVGKDRFDQDKNIQLRIGSILVTKDGTLGKVAYVKELDKPATLNAGVFNVLVNDELDIDSVYLFQYLKAPFLMDFIEKGATGGTIKHLNQGLLVNFPINISSYGEQQRIGRFFCDLDTLITLHQRKLDKLKNIKKALLDKMFI